MRYFRYGFMILRSAVRTPVCRQTQHVIDTKAPPQDRASLEEALAASVTAVFSAANFWQVAKANMDVEIQHGRNERESSSMDVLWRA
eukprot:4520667-Prymnesium_polylepis.1